MYHAARNGSSIHPKEYYGIVKEKLAQCHVEHEPVILSGNLSDDSTSVEL